MILCKDPDEKGYCLSAAEMREWVRVHQEPLPEPYEERICHPILGHHAKRGRQSSVVDSGSQTGTNQDIFSLSKVEYLMELPDGHYLLQENHSVAYHPDGCDEVPALVESLRDLVSAVAPNTSSERIEVTGSSALGRDPGIPDANGMAGAVERGKKVKRSLVGRVLDLEISNLYRSVTRRLIEIYEEQHKKPEPQVSNASFDVSEAARRLNVRPGLVRKLVKEGRLKAHRIGKLIRFSQTALDEFLASQVMKAKPKPEPKGKRRREVLPVARTEIESKTITRAAIKKLWK